jgi:hypothetical protein
MWQETSQKPRRFLSNGTYRGIAILAAVALYFIVPIVAPYVIGARGDLLALVFEWLIIFGLGGMFAALCFVLFKAMERRLRWAAFCGLLVFGSLFLFALYEIALSGLDAVLPFKGRDVVVARTYYEEPQTGRGALPETGGWHLVTASGDDYRVRESGDGNQVRPGRYHLELSRFKDIVISEELR